jgi:hypothetical protein
MADVIYRPALESDLNFVLSSWLKSYCRSRQPNVSKEDYYKGHSDLLIRLLSSVDTTIACPDGNENVIIGFCAHAGQIVHYIYVKNTFRSKYVDDKRIAYDLLRECVDVSKDIVMTHQTIAGDKFLSNNRLTASYNPYPAYLGWPSDWSNDGHQDQDHHIQ